MGEAMYYIRARFKDKATAKEVLPRFQAVNREGVEAHEYWQKHRDMKREQFFAEFNAKFPLIAECLGEHTLDNHNGLAGILEFIDEEGDGNIWQDGRDIAGNAYLWHFASLDLLDEWLKRNGAVKVIWTSDEDESGSIGELLKYKIEEKSAC